VFFFFFLRYTIYFSSDHSVTHVAAEGWDEVYTIYYNTTRTGEEDNITFYKSEAASEAESCCC